MKIFKYTAESHMGTDTESHFFTVSSLKHASPIHSHDFFELFLVTRGRALHIVNGVSLPIAEGTLVFIRPDDVHYYEQEGNHDMEFINICCTKQAMDTVFSFLGDAIHPDSLLSPPLPPSITLSPMEKELLKDRLEHIGLAGDKTQTQGLLRAVLVELLIHYFWQYQHKQEEPLPLWLESLLIQMKRKENFIQGIPRMYDLSGRSPGHINRVFKNRLSTTPVEYINGLRLEYAKHLLATTNLSITEISLSCGFNNLSHYYHLFKSKFGVTPLEFRSRYSQ